MVADRAIALKERAKLKTHLLEVEIASKAVAHENNNNARLQRDAEKKRTAQMRDHFLNLGLSPVSATTKAKFAESLLHNM